MPQLFLIAENSTFVIVDLPVAKRFKRCNQGFERWDITVLLFLPRLSAMGSDNLILSHVPSVNTFSLCYHITALSRFFAVRRHHARPATVFGCWGKEVTKVGGCRDIARSPS
jgi:hypothetical protein